MSAELDRARDSLRAGDWPAALDLAWSARSATPDDDRPLRIAAIALAHLGRATTARAAADAATTIAPDDPRTWLVRAHIDLLSTDVDDTTLRAAEKAAFLDPGGPDPQRVLGTVRLAVGELEGAVRALVTAVRLDPHRSSASAGLEAALVRRRERDELLAAARIPSSTDGPNRVAERMSRVVTYSLLALAAILAPPVLTGVIDLGGAALLVCVIGVVLRGVTAIPLLLDRSPDGIRTRRHVSTRRRVRRGTQFVALVLLAGTNAVSEAVAIYLVLAAVAVLLADAASDLRLPRRREHT